MGSWLVWFELGVCTNRTNKNNGKRTFDASVHSTDNDFHPVHVGAVLCPCVSVQFTFELFNKIPKINIINKAYFFNKWT